MSLIAATIDAFEGAPCPTSSARRRSPSWWPTRAADADQRARRRRHLRPRDGGATIAEHTDAANAQHYEVPAEFFLNCLGPQLKYSSALYLNPGDTLADAEEHGLRETAQHADLQDGQRILELGCGWGSLSLWMAKTYPNARITAVSNSASQRAFILAGPRSAPRNLEVITCDMNDFEAPGEFRPRGLGGDVRAHGQLARPALRVRAG